jgi:hypothetical protein
MAVIGFLSEQNDSARLATIALSMAVSTSLMHNEHVLISGMRPCMLRSQEISPSHFQDDDIVPILRGRLDWTKNTALIGASYELPYQHYFVGLDQHQFQQDPEEYGEIDTLVVCLQQNIHELTRFFQNRILQSVLKSFKTRQLLYVITDYDIAARLNLVEIKRRFQFNAPIFSLPYSTTIRNAINEQELIDVFTRYLFATKSTNDRSFSQYMNECKGISDLLVCRSVLK